MLLLDPRNPRVFQLPGLRKDAAQYLKHLLLEDTNTTTGRSKNASHRHRDTLHLIVDSGPDSGTVFSLPRGESLIGRGPGRIQLNDPTTSREHALLRVDPTGITVTALDGEVTISGERVSSGSSARGVTDADTVTVGDTTLRLVVAVRRQRGSGPLPQGLDVSMQAPPRFPWLGLVMAIAPLGIGIVLWVALGSWFMMVFGALGVLTGSFMVGQNIADRRRYRRTLRQRAWQHIETLRRHAPTPARVVASWHQRSSHLGSQQQGARGAAAWSGGASASAQTLSLRIGSVRERRIRLTVNGEPSSVALSSRLRRKPVVWPAVVHVQPGATVTICGPPARCLGVLSAVVVSFLERGIPAGWGMVLPASSRLPARLLGINGVRFDSAVNSYECLLIPPGSAFPSSAAHSPSATHSPSAAQPSGAAQGSGAVQSAVTVKLETRSSLASEGVALPGDWVISCAESSAAGPQAVVLSEGTRQDFCPDTISFDALDHAALTYQHNSGSQQSDASQQGDAAQLGGTPDIGGSPHSSGEPHSTDEPHSSDAPVETADARYGVATDLGITSAGAPLVIDIVKDGPHALIAGTTGSGKSELLRSWVLGLADRYSPEELRLALVDFKGGATFSDLEALPHIETCVTDLDGSEIYRIVEALRVELTRREELLNEASVADISELEHAPPRLILMIDEFRILAQDHPSILTDIMRLATLGRALGLHLVLATQRPQGIVTPEIKANISLVLCLRLVDAADSMSLINSPAAAQIPASEPGSVIISSSGSPLIHGLVEPTSDAPPTLRVGVLGPRVTDISAREVCGGGIPTLAQRLERILARAPQQLSDALIPPPLPETVCPHELFTARSSPDAELPLGLMNTPQVRITEFAPPMPYSIGMCGADGNEDATVIRGLAHILGGNATDLATNADLAAKTDLATNAALDGNTNGRGPSASSVIVLDGLGLLRSTKHAWGCYVGPDQTSLATEVLRELKNGRFPNATADAHAGVPPTLWIISPHSWWSDPSERAANYREHAVRELALKGEIGIIINGGRDLATSRIFTTLTHRIYLPFAVPAEARHIWPRIRPVPSLPGRGVLSSASLPADGLAIQLPTADTEPQLADNPHRWDENRTPHTVTLGGLTQPTLERSAPSLHITLIPSQTPVLVQARPAGLVIGADDRARNTLINAWCSGYTVERIDPEATSHEPEEDQEEKTIWVIDNAEALSPSLISLCQRRIKDGKPIIFGASAPARLPYLMPWWRNTALGTHTIAIPPLNGSDYEPLGWNPPLATTTQPGHVLVNINQATYRAIASHVP